MKILHISETLKGGIESYLSDLTYYQCQHGYEVSLVSQENNIHGLNQYCFKNRGRFFNLLALSFISLVVIFIKRPDVIHIHSSFAGTIRPIICVFKRLIFLKVQLIYCSHGWPFTVSSKECINNFYKKVEQFFSFFCDKIICISSSEYKEAVNAKIKDIKLVQIHNGVSDTSLSIVSDSPKKITLLFVGRFDKQKGLDILLDAFSKTKIDIQLKIIGEPVLFTNNDLKNKYTNDQRITWLGWLSRKEIIQYYAHASATIIPSRYEGFGLVAVESLMMGTPVICSSVGGLLDICRDQKNGYLFNLSVDDLVEVLNNLDKEKLDSMRSEARKTYLSNFTAETMFQKTDLLYRSENTDALPVVEPT